MFRERDFKTGKYEMTFAESDMNEAEWEEYCALLDEQRSERVALRNAQRKRRNAVAFANRAIDSLVEEFKR